jgi:hypothetical protein
MTMPMKVSMSAPVVTRIRSSATTYANFRENIYVLRSNGGVFQHNITHGGVNSLFLKHATFNRFENNTFHDRTARPRDSHDNQFVSNDFINAGLHFQAYKEGATLAVHPERGGGWTSLRPNPVYVF